MKIQFFGAAQTVTGSKHLITTDKNIQILLDCGLFQGIKTNELNLDLGFKAAEIDFLVLSHAHIDHSGLIPRLIKLGFEGAIYSTPATKSLCEIMLYDSAKIQESDLKRVNERRVRRGEEPLEILYDEADVAKALSLFKTMDYHQDFFLTPEIKVSFSDTGHLLGSAAISLTIREEDEQEKHVFFSGDIGRPNDKILRMSEPFKQAEYIICESTYGNRLHEPENDVKTHLLKIVNDTCVKQQGKLIIPAFSVDRTQELIYALDQLHSEGLLPKVQVFIDSPLSVKATQVMQKHTECFNPEILNYIKKDGDAFNFPNLFYVSDVEESKQINLIKEPCIIISSSGMAEAGRIKHHIKHNIEDPRTTILLVGYCTPNSLGGQLKAGAEEVKIFGELFQVKAHVEVMDSFSAHADYKEMIDFLSCQDAGKVKKVFLVHGEKDVQDDFREKLLKVGYGEVIIPAMKQSFDL
ncbi:MAG: MBL fold metallo-hydrolase [Verrucomicrobia bacterium]|nr:MBL fold metallo-hydrolase [Cytophagales bacterium]